MLIEIPRLMTKGKLRYIQNKKWDGNQIGTLGKKWWNRTESSTGGTEEQKRFKM